MTEEGRQLLFTGVFVVLAAAVGLLLVATHGTVHWVAPVILGTLMVGLLGAFILWLRKRPNLPAAEPDSVPARIEHWLHADAAPESVRYCPQCGRQRLVLTPFNYLPTSPAEDRARCTPNSCPAYNEPALDAPPSQDAPRVPKRRW